MSDRPFRWAVWFASLCLLVLIGSAVVALMGCNQSPGLPSPELQPPAQAASSGTGAQKLTLDEAQREYLWQIEHHGLLLSKHGFGAIKAALVRNDAQAFHSLLAKDFTGAVYAQPREVRVTNDFLQVVRQQAAGESGLPLNGSQFVERLLAYRHSFVKPPQVAINLMKLAPAEPDNLDSPLWQGSCQLRMWGESVPGQPTEVVLNLEYGIPSLLRRI